MFFHGNALIEVSKHEKNPTKLSIIDTFKHSEVLTYVQRIPHK